MNALRDTRGTALIEMIVYFAIIAILLNICSVTFVRATRLSSLTAERLLRQQAMDRFARDFGETVRGASALLKRAGPFTTDSRTMIVKTDTGATAMGVMDDMLALWTLEPDGADYRIAYGRSYPVRHADARFDYENVATRRIVFQLKPLRIGRVDNGVNDRTLIATMRAHTGAP